jgi:3-methyladenine DNA glycosylase AlkD
MRGATDWDRSRGERAVADEWRETSPDGAGNGLWGGRRGVEMPGGTERRAAVEGKAGKMALSARAEGLVAEITRRNPKLGDLKKRGAEIKQDHDLAIELWSTGEYYPRLLATLIFDRKLLAENVIDELASEMLRHNAEERCQLADWLLANQLAKDKKLASLITTWEKNPSPILRRLFWYHQARLRWVGQAPPGNSADLLDSLEDDMAHAEPEVQWAMNFCAGQIGVHEPKFRSRCIELGEELGLYKDEHVARNCTPSYLPEFIRIEAAKRG